MWVLRGIFHCRTTDMTSRRRTCWQPGDGERRTRMEPSTLVLIIGIPVGIILILYGLFDTKKRRDTPDLVTEFNDDPTTDTFDHGGSDAQSIDRTSVETVPAAAFAPDPPSAEPAPETLVPPAVLPSANSSDIAAASPQSPAAQPPAAQTAAARPEHPADAPLPAELPTTDASRVGTSAQVSTEQASTEQASGVEPPSVGNGGSADSATPQNG